MVELGRISMSIDREADLDDVDNNGSLPPCFRCYDAIDWASPRYHACCKPFGTTLA